jgi:hypothetical protein
LKRKTTKPSYGIGGITKFDAEKVVGKGTLQAIGEVVILWNGIEHTLDETLAEATNLPSHLRTTVRSRISGLEAKADILKECLHEALYFCELDRSLLADTLGDFMVLKGYRDNLVHMRLVGRPGLVQAFAPEKRGARYELLFSKRLILAVASRLRLFRTEMRILSFIVFLRHISMYAHNAARLGYKEDEMRELAERTILKDLQRLRAIRTRRLALRPLPEFPAVDRTAKWGVVTMQSEERRAIEAKIEAARAKGALPQKK